MGQNKVLKAFVVTAAIAAFSTVAVLAIHTLDSPAVAQDRTAANGAFIFNNISDRPMDAADIAEKEQQEAAFRALVENTTAAIVARRAEEEAAARQAAAEEAERKAAEAAAAAPKTHSPGDYSDVLMVGDSIMVVSSWSIEGYLPGVTLDACSGRSLEVGGVAEGSGNGDGVLDHIRQLDTSRFDRYVIGTGNNDYLGMDYASGEEIVSLLAGKEIWFVTEYVTNNSAGTANTNSTIDALCESYPNVHKIDWYSVASANRDAYLGSDNCHPQNEAATSAYASLVKEALDA